MTGDIDAAGFMAALTPQLPLGIAVRRVKPITAGRAALTAIVNLASYRVRAPLAAGAALEAATEAVARFHRAASAPYVKTGPKGRREIDLKAFVGQIAPATRADGLELALDIKITPAGSVKPREVLTALRDNFGLPVDPEAAAVTRTGLYIADGTGRATPLEL